VRYGIVSRNDEPRRKAGVLIAEDITLFLPKLKAGEGIKELFSC